MVDITPRYATPTALIDAYGHPRMDRPTLLLDQPDTSYHTLPAQPLPTTNDTMDKTLLDSPQPPSSSHPAAGGHRPSGSLLALGDELRQLKNQLALCEQERKCWQECMNDFQERDQALMDLLTHIHQQLDRLLIGPASSTCIHPPKKSVHHHHHYHHFVTSPWPLERSRSMASPWPSYQPDELPILTSSSAAVAATLV
ncbi:hypothetical protein DM01DRAFT_1331160 [Hesseltinella vesiculosa]|uniref:Uncharacterized protein n=1 Tax=Hesseltinella vesiculosa TaxID=101127 RepID=A0A1X2GYC2_9FUNG|nr:hypothetical protein DM01DRAFT_1331160 [Hesseltinella vesiculosa]